VLKPEDFVTDVAGRSGSRVDNLQVTITDGRRVGGGGSGGAPFDLANPSGYFTMGFHGRSGSELDAIGVTYGKLEPATWHPWPNT
jgi:hypothetical protein